MSEENTKYSNVLSNIDIKYNERIDKIYEIEEDLPSEITELDDNYVTRLKLLALEEKDETALEEYKKIEDISKLSKEEKDKLTKENGNGVLNLSKYNLTPHSYLYVLSSILGFKGTKRLFKIESVNKKRDFMVRKLGINDSELILILKDEKNKYLRNALLLEKIENETSKEVPAINYLFKNKEDIKQILCASKIKNIEIVKRIIKGEFGDFGDETINLILINSNMRILEELIKDDKLFETEQNLREELVKKLDILKKLTNVNERIETIKELKIPFGMNVGVELEVLGPISYYLYGDLIGEFNGKQDITIHDKNYKEVEIISPILTNDNIDTVFYMAEQLTKLNEFTNESCGGHIHIDSEYLTVKDKSGNIDLLASKLAWKSFLELWKSTENIMYKISNKEGEEHRGIKFTMPLAPKIDKMLKCIDIGSNKSLKQLKAQFKKIQIDDESILSERNFSVNLDNLNNNKNTIEFRLPNGTLEKDELKSNILLFTKLIYVFREIGIIEAKLLQNKELTEEEKQTLEHKLTLTKNDEMEESKRFEKLMELLFTNDNEREIYKKRYYNSNFNIAKEVEKMDNPKKIDYTKYGEPLSDEEIKRFKNYNRKIRYEKAQYDELAEECVKEKPRRFQNVITSIRSFINNFRKRVISRNENEHEE